MKTAITDLFGIEHPIIQGGMHYVGLASLASAVSNAGGLGMITALTQRTPAQLAEEIAKCREMTDKPFGVNVTFLPAVIPPDYPGYIKAIVDGGVTIVETAGNNPEKWLPALKSAGVNAVDMVDNAPAADAAHMFPHPHSDSSKTQPRRPDKDRERFEFQLTNACQRSGPRAFVSPCNETSFARWHATARQRLSLSARLRSRAGLLPCSHRAVEIISVAFREC
jgi:hypothetical protein